MQGSESYFVTTQDQDAVVGRLVRERRDLEQKCAALEAEAQRLGHRLIVLGQALAQDPGRIVLAGEAVDSKLAMTAHTIHQSELDEIARIPTLTADYRETYRLLKENGKLLGQFGWAKES